MKYIGVNELFSKYNRAAGDYESRYSFDYILIDNSDKAAVKKDAALGGRRRKNQIRVRLNDDELKVVEEKFKKSGCRSREAFMRKALTELKIINIDFEPVKRNNYLISNIANNINQMATMANEANSVTVVDFEKLRKEVNDIWPLLKSTLSQLQSISR